MKMNHQRQVALLAAVLLSLFTSGTNSADRRPSCAEVRRTFAVRQIGPLKIVPWYAIKTNKLQICSNEHPTCCKRQMERRYQQHADVNLQQILHKKMTSLKLLFTNFARDFQDDLNDLIFSFREETLVKVNSSFHDVMGASSLDNIIGSLFDDIIIARDEETLRGATERIPSSVNSFFRRLFSLAFKRERSATLTQQQTECVANQSAALSYYHNIPDFISMNIVKSITLSSVLVQAIESGVRALDLPSSVFVNEECQKALVRMQFCSHCYSLTLIKPCQGLCRNVINGCLVGISEVDLFWSHYVGGLTALVTNMTEEDTDIQSTIAVISEKLNEAINMKMHKNTRRSIEETCSISLRRSKRSAGDQGRPTSHRHKRRHRRRNRRNRNAQLRLTSGLETLEGRVSTRKALPPPHLMLNGDSFVPLKVRSEELRTEKERERETEVTRASENMNEGFFDPDQKKLHLKSKLRRFVALLNFSREFFSDIPDQLCSSHAEAALPVSNRGNCWDGKEIANSYSTPVAAKGLESQFQNPEVKIEGIGREVQITVENLRISSKILLLQSGKIHIPQILLESPHYIENVKVEGTANERINAPCGDDEDACKEIDVSSGDGQGDKRDESDHSKKKTKGNTVSKDKEENKKRRRKPEEKFVSAPTKLPLNTTLRMSINKKTVLKLSQDGGSETTGESEGGKRENGRNTAQGMVNCGFFRRTIFSQVLFTFILRYLL